MAMVEEEINPSFSEEEKEKEKEKEKEREGRNLLGLPTFREMENGRFKCVETGHELPAKDMDSYIQSKRCRLGLIDAAVSQKKPPLNMFKQDPLSRSKLICKLTGNTINKSEEHIWKHINGKKFLNKLEQMESEKLTSNGMLVEKDSQLLQHESKPSEDGVEKHKKKKSSSKGKDKKNEVDKGEPQEGKPIDNGSDSEELDFWIPPVGSRWDFDDGQDRWGSGTDSEQETDEGNEIDEEGVIEAGELSSRTKRMSIEIGPSSFASRKKKSKTNCTSNPSNN